jgi:hypothetical protein
MLIFALLGGIAAVSLNCCGVIIWHRAKGGGPDQIRTVPAKLVGLETGTTPDSWPPRKVAGTCHANFELSWERRRRFAVTVEECERLVIGDSGELRFRGSRFVEFKPLK